MEVKIPYSTTYKTLKIDDDRVKGVLNSYVHEYNPAAGQEGTVLNALENPIDSIRLQDMAREAKNILVITSDHTRPVPSKITLPLLLKEIRILNPDVKIKILIATGFHRSSTYDEMVDKYGLDIVNNEDIINHDCHDKSNLVFKGILPSGGELWVNSLVDWAELVVSEGFIEPHFFAGFSGGRKSILPGIAGAQTVLANHCSKFIANSFARAGMLENNPIHKDMLYVSNVAKLAFILNVVINQEKEVIHAFAGNPKTAHLKGCTFVEELAKVDAVQSEIVITSNGGYPLDQNIYQSVKGMTAAEACVRQDGVVIMVSACNDGHGGEDFYRWLADAKSAEEVAKKIGKISQEETIADQWEAQILARILMKCRVIIVTDMCDPKMIKDMHMIHASTLEEALDMADQMVGKDSGITIIPDGVGVIVK